MRDTRARSTGTASYVVTDDLKMSVNAAIGLPRPLLIKGEPGTGKTVLAQEVAAAIGAELIEWHIKSTTKAHQGCGPFWASNLDRGLPRRSEADEHLGSAAR